MKKITPPPSPFPPSKKKKRINEFANFFPEVKKMSSTKTQEQDCILYFKTKEYQG